VSSPESDWVTVAVLGKTRGNRGEITAFALSSKPERYEHLHEVTLFDASGQLLRTAEIESVWFHSGALIFKFRGVDSISDAEALSRVEVRVPLSERAPLEEGEYFDSDLVGCEVIDRVSGESLGHVTGVEDAGGPGLLVVDGNLMIPFARAICVEIDPAAKRIIVELPAGLKDLNRS
jgi:16S rRNA processing protein RimM